jgi:hypothetical protein
VGALDRLRAANGDGGFLGRAREDGRLLVAITAGAILLLAWIGWAIYVTSSDGARAGLGVVLAWPAMLAGLAIISLPIIGIFLLIRYLAGGGDPDATENAGDTDDAADTGEEDEDPEEEADADSNEDDEGDSDEDEDESEGDEESEDEPEAEASKAG